MVISVVSSAICETASRTTDWLTRLEALGSNKAGRCKNAQRDINLVIVVLLVVLLYWKIFGPLPPLLARLGDGRRHSHLVVPRLSELTLAAASTSIQVPP